MLYCRPGRALICGLIFLLGVFSARSIAADGEGEVQSTLMMEWPIDMALEPAPAPLARLKIAFVALPEPAPAAIRPAIATTVKRVPATTPPAWPGPARFFTINEVLAKRKRVAPGTQAVQLAAVDRAGTVSDAPSRKTPPISGDEPFGLFTFRAPEGQLWQKWRKVEADIKTGSSVLARCEAQSGECPPAAARFTAIIKDAEQQQGRARLELVNRRINDAIRYRNDVTQWAAPDVWSAPFDERNTGSLDTGIGDCEDYAIAKYVALRQAGVAAGDLRLLLVRDNAVRLAHAVVAARDDGRWLILDNRWNRLVEDIELRQFVPLFALGEDGVQLFAAPYVSVQPATIDETAQSATNKDDQIIAVGTGGSPAPHGSLASGGGPLPLLM